MDYVPALVITLTVAAYASFLPWDRIVYFLFRDRRTLDHTSIVSEDSIKSDNIS